MVEDKSTFPFKVKCIYSDESYDRLKEGEIYIVECEYAHGDWVLDGVVGTWDKGRFEIVREEDVQQSSEEYTGSSVSYYSVPVDNPTDPDKVPYIAECNDIIEALNMNYAEGNAFKAIWRSCAARRFGVAKKGYDNGLYDAEKVVFFGLRMVAMAEKK